MWEVWEVRLTAPWFFRLPASLAELLWKRLDNESEDYAHDSQVVDAATLQQWRKFLPC
jgi:hypothetical protein